jgi:hypothetical protein
MLLFFLIFHSLSLDFLKQTAVVNHRRLQIDRAHLKADQGSAFRVKVLEGWGSFQWFRESVREVQEGSESGFKALFYFATVGSDRF